MSERLDVSQVKIDPAVALAVPPTLSLRRRVLPFARVNGTVHVACANPSDAAVMHALKRHFKSEPLKLQAAEPKSLQAALEQTYGAAAPKSTRRLLRARQAQAVEGEDEGTVGLCMDLLRAAVLRQASDLHIDPEFDGIRIRLRVDGQLDDYRKLPLEQLSSLISRFKVLSDMDIAERRAPQDGRFTHEYGDGKAVELRVATLPTKYGERMTLRLLALQTEELTLERLGMFPDQLSDFDAQLQQPHGLLLVTGPTGSGKSTTLYAGIRRLIAARSLNVITVEDPIEFDIHGVAQVEVDSGDKVSFQKALRSILRHDPDVIMIGETRDRETADVALQAALTGHLVFSTLHTNSAVGAISRLRDMGLEPFLLAATLRLSAAQRLVRQLCTSCREPRPLSAREAELLERPAHAGMPVYEAQGCVYCAGRGHSGRIGLFELVRLSGEWSERIASAQNEPQLLEAMREQGIPTLSDSAFRRVKEGRVAVNDALAAMVRS